MAKNQLLQQECVETESCLKLLFENGSIDEDTFKKQRNLCGRIQRLLTASCITYRKENHSKITYPRFDGTTVKSGLFHIAQPLRRSKQIVRRPFPKQYCPDPDGQNGKNAKNHRRTRITTRKA